jgi:hypothetical protein
MSIDLLLSQEKKLIVDIKDHIEFHRIKRRNLSPFLLLKKEGRIRACHCEKDCEAHHDI